MLTTTNATITLFCLINMADMTSIAMFDFI